MVLIEPKVQAGSHRLTDRVATPAFSNTEYVGEENLRLMSPMSKMKPAPLFKPDTYLVGGRGEWGDERLGRDTSQRTYEQERLHTWNRHLTSNT